MILINRYRAVPHRYVYRTVRYGTVPLKQRTVNVRKYMPQAGIEPALLTLNIVNRKKSRVPRVSRKSIEMALSILWAKSIEDDHLDT